MYAIVYLSMQIHHGHGSVGHLVAHILSSVAEPLGHKEVDEACHVVLAGQVWRHGHQRQRHPAPPAPLVDGLLHHVPKLVQLGGDHLEYIQRIYSLT